MAASYSGHGGDGHGADRAANHTAVRKNYNYPGFRTIKKSLIGWYSISVFKVNNCDETLSILQQLMAPNYFVPYNISYLPEKRILTFFVDEHDIALAIKNIKLKAMYRNNFKLHFIYVNNHFPFHLISTVAPVPDRTIHHMAEVIASRFDAHRKFMDLSKFHASPPFTNNGLFVPLNQPTIFLAALNMVAKYTSHDVHCLSLENNNIYYDHGFVWICRLFPSLQVLIFSNNKLLNVGMLKRLEGFLIKELYLSRNPFSYTLDMQPSHLKYYVESVQRLFPMVCKLDDMFLKPKVFYDRRVGLPNRGNSFPTVNGQPDQALMSSISQFLMFFFKNYREETWLKAYHEESALSMSCCHVVCNAVRATASPYLVKSRNLTQFDLFSAANRTLVFNGINDVVDFLKNLAEVEHDIESFVIDVPFVNYENGMVQVVVNGVFVEVIRHRRCFRTFSRAFILVPSGSSYVIKSDLLFVTLSDQDELIESIKRHSKRINEQSLRETFVSGPNGQLSIDRASIDGIGEALGACSITDEESLANVENVSSRP